MKKQLSFRQLKGIPFSQTFIKAIQEYREQQSLKRRKAKQEKPILTY